MKLIILGRIKLTMLIVESNIKIHRFEIVKGREFGECLVSSKKFKI